MNLCRPVQLVLVFALVICSLPQYVLGQNSARMDARAAARPFGTPSRLDHEPIGGSHRCSFSEMNALIHQANPGLPNEASFEQWINRAKLQVSPVRSVVTLPVVVHILHDGSSVGLGYNLSSARVQSQIDVLNKDFRRLNSDTTNTPSQYLSVASDLEVEFRLATRGPDGLPLKEPGINRIDKIAAGWDAGAVSVSYVNSQIKAETQWDPELYINIWVVPLSANKLGSAQFPQQSGLQGLNYNNAANTDGLVITTNAFGVNPAYSPYNLGRTATHEMGHFLGLRHIWGDGGCGFDDYCGDTPASDQSHLGCQAGVQSCGSRDMVENFMDYSDDGCMNLFTEDQKSRVMAVLQFSPRRANLANSDRATPLGPELYFSDGRLDWDEGSATGSDCDQYTDYILDLEIAAATTTGGTADLLVMGGNATQGKDYDFVNGNSFTFLPGQTSSSQLTLRLYEDGLLEGMEDLELKLDLGSSGLSDLMLLSEHDSIRWEFQDDEKLPSMGLVDTLLWENFEDLAPNTLPSGWQISTGGGSAGSNSWVINSVSAIGGSASAHISDGTGAYQYTKNSLSTSYFVTPLLHPKQGEEAVLEFDYMVEGELYFNTIYDYGQVYFSFDAVNFTPLTERLYDLADTIHHMTLALPDSLAGQEFYLAFGWVNDQVEGFDPPFMIDNVSVQVGSEQVSSLQGAKASHYLGPYQTIYYYDESTGDLIGSIENLGGYDYGCTTFEIDRNGNGVEPFLDAGNPSSSLMAKTFKVTPTNNDPAGDGDYRITLYYTPEEVQAYEQATGEYFKSANIIKTPGSISEVHPGLIIVPLGIENMRPLYADTLRYAYAIQAEFSTGFSGFGVGQPSNSNRNAFPIDYLQFDVWEEADQAIISWNFETDNGVSEFQVERSVDGIAFQPLVNIPGNAKDLTGAYRFTDQKIGDLGQATLFYRVRGVDVDGGVYLTEVRTLSLNQRELRARSYPVPFQEELTVEIQQPAQEGWVTLQLTDLQGRILFEDKKSLKKGVHPWVLSTDQLSSGLYLVKVHGGQQQAVHRVMKN